MIYQFKDGVHRIVKRVCQGCKLAIDGAHHNRRYCSNVCKARDYRRAA